MSIKIEKKITRYAVQKPDEVISKTESVYSEKADVKAAALAVSSRPVEKIIAEKRPKAEVIRMHEKLERPDMLIGSTYKVKTPVSDHAMYITINDILLNEGTPYEQRRPFEIFINSKNLDHFQWIVALTRIISAVFRKGGDVTFLVEELKAVFDPRGGYWKPGGHFMPSLIAEIGEVIEKHLIMIGLMHKDELDEHQKQLVAEKRAEFEAATKQTDAFAESKFPAGAQLCAKCNNAAVVMMDGCMTCLNCGDSKCG
ncbi:MAG: NrdJb [Gammaproteobacteria bacterium]|nr:NrdJb [Gammaproteobacteria bacterium]